MICSTDLHAQFGQFANLLNGKSRTKSVAHVNLKQAGDSKSVVQAQEYKFLSKRLDGEILIGNAMAVILDSVSIPIRTNWLCINCDGHQICIDRLLRSPDW